LYTAVCLFGVSRVTIDNDPLKLLRSNEPDQEVLEWLTSDFAELERNTVIVVEGEDLLTRGGIEALREITERTEAIEGVRAAYSILDLRASRRVGRYLLPLLPSAEASDERFERARQEVLSHPLGIGHFLSDDLKTSLVIVQFDHDVLGLSRFQEVLSELRATLEEREAEDVGVRITGSATLQVEIVATIRNDIARLSLLGASLVVLLAMILFRSIGAALLVASGPAVGAIWTVGTLGLIGEPINMLTNIVPLLVLVIGFTDSMHLVLHMRRAVAAGSSSREAAESAIRHLGLACALTSLSTAVGFGSLMMASLIVIQKFGWCCALGSVLSFFAVITVVPLLAGTRLGRTIVASRPVKGHTFLGRLADGILTRLLRYHRIVAVSGLALCVLLALVTTRMEPDHTVAAEIPHSSEAYQALVHVDKTLGGAMFVYATLTWPEEQGLRWQELYDTLGEVHRAVDANSLLSGPLSILNFVESLPGEGEGLAARASQLNYLPKQLIRRQLNPEARQAVISMHMPDAGARRLKPAFEELDEQFAEIERRHPGYQVELVGGAVVVFRSVHQMIEDLWRSLATAAGVMFLMIWLGLRSLRYALLSIVPNVFPLLCTAAFIVITGRYLEMSGVIVFCISLGIAVDDTIHFLVRFRRERQSGAKPREAVRVAFRRVGTALVMTTVALIAGHAVVFFSAFPAIQRFGLLAAITIGSALVGDLLILPAMLVWRAGKEESTAGR
jgi:predicted RND superfamily exporter protein